METILSLGFLLFGLGFFVLVTRMIASDHREAEERRIRERREFGDEDKKQLKRSRTFLRR